MESEREEAVGAECLPAAVFADGHRGGAAAVVVDESLVAVVEVLFDCCEESVGEVVIFSKVVTLGEVDNFDVGSDGGGFGFFGERDKGVFRLGEVEVGDERGGGAEEAGDFEVASDERGEAESAERGPMTIWGVLEFRRVSQARWRSASVCLLWRRVI